MEKESFEISLQSFCETPNEFYIDKQFRILFIRIIVFVSIDVLEVHLPNLSNQIPFH